MGYQGSALKIECPFCKERDSHDVYKSDPNFYYWGKDSTPLFERLVGRDLHYRSRKRKCSKCHNVFETVEMCFDYLHALMLEIERLEEEKNKLKSRMKEASEFLIKPIIENEA